MEQKYRTQDRKKRITIRPDELMMSIDDAIGERFGSIYTKEEMVFSDKDMPYAHSAEDMEEEIKTELGEDCIIVPLFMYEHGMVALNTGGFSCPWDSGQIGYIAVSREKANQELSERETVEEKARQIMETEISEIEKVINGDVWSITVELISVCDCCGVENAEIEEPSVCGIVGEDAVKTMLEHDFDIQWDTLTEEA